MSYAIWVVIFSTLCIALYSGLAVFSTYQYIRRPVIAIFWGLCVSIVAIFLGLNITFTTPGAPPPDFDLLQSFIHLDVEGTMPNTFSGVLLAAITMLAGCLLIVCYRQKERLEALLWLLLGLMFAIATYDEWGNPIGVHGETGTLLIYAVSGGLAGCLLLYLAWQTHQPTERWHYVLLIGSLGAIATGGIVLDKRILPFIPPVDDIGMIEEVIETLGIITIVIVALHIASEKISPGFTRFATGVLLIAFMAIGVSNALSPRLHASIEYWTGDLCEDGTSFGDELITLVAYDCPPERLQPGDTFGIYLYFRSEKRVPDNYSFSAHLVSLPDLTSIGQADTETVGDGTLTSFWLPGTLYKQPVVIEIPDTITEPGGYALLVRVWHSDTRDLDSLNEGNWQTATDGLQITETTRPIINTDMLQLLKVAILPPENITTLTGTTLSFGNGIDLTAQLTSEIDSQMKLDFLWATSQSVPIAWTQILHLRHIDSGELFVFDRAPFDSRFPTDTWPADMQAQETIMLELPEDLPSGAYELLSGLYEVQSGQRAALANSTDNLRVIGELSIQTDND